jgi:hypothetical protein
MVNAASDTRDTLRNNYRRETLAGGLYTPS